jgi:hypothetical protein
VLLRFQKRRRPTSLSLEAPRVIGLETHLLIRGASHWLQRTSCSEWLRFTAAPHREVVFSCGWSSSHCTARGEPIVRSSHMYVGQEGQAVTIRRQVPPNQLLHSTANLTRRRRCGRQLHCRPSRLRTRPLHAASDPRVGHQVPPLHVLSCSGCPTRTARPGSATLLRIEQSLFTAVPLLGSEQVPLRAEWVMASIDARSPATSSAARAAAPVIVAATRAERPHQRL